MLSGIYKIVNTKNGKFYIGSTKNLEQRWKKHLKDLSRTRHCNIHLQRSYNKHGNVFKFEILEYTIDLFNRERYWIDELKPEYNIGAVGGGDNITNHPNYDILAKERSADLQKWRDSLTEEDKLKISESMKGEGNPNWRGGRTFCECGARINSNNDSCSKCQNKAGKNNPFFGKKHSDKTKEILKLKNTGKRLSDEAKLKCKQAAISYYNSPEGLKYKKARGKLMSGENHPLFGVGHSTESCAKMSKTKKENISNMTIENRFLWNKKRKVRCVRIYNCYYLSILEAKKFYAKSLASLRFRCDSKNDKWKDYEFIVIENFTQEQDIDIINKILDTIATPIYHTE